MIEANTNTNSNSNDLYGQGINNVLQSIILYSTSFRRIAIDLGELYSGSEVQPYDYITLFTNFYARTNQLIESVSFAFAELIRKSTSQDYVRSRTTNSLKKEILEDSFQELSENLRQFRSLIVELGITVDTKMQQNENLNTTLSAGAISAVLSGTRRISFTDGVVMASIVNHTNQNTNQINIMQQQKIDLALAAMVSTTLMLNNLTVRLMDQYCSLVYGGNVNLDVRDHQLRRVNSDVNLIAELCNKIAFSAKEIYNQSATYVLQNRGQATKKPSKSLNIVMMILILLVGLVFLANSIYSDSFLGIMFSCVCFWVAAQLYINLKKISSFVNENYTETLQNEATAILEYNDQLRAVADKYVN